MSEQMSDIRDNSREESVRSAMEDIALIRRMIDHTEINMHRLGWLFLVYGLVFLVYSLIEAFSTAVVAHTCRPLRAVPPQARCNCEKRK